MTGDDPHAANAAEWIDVGPLAAFPAGMPRLVRVVGRRVVVARQGDAAIAADDACPHRGDPLSQGWIWEGRWYCPSHGWAFEAADGRCSGGDPAARLPVHAARIRDGRVEVRLLAAAP